MAGFTPSSSNRDRGLVPTSLGLIHYVRHLPASDTESKLPLLCCHMSPRSSDEYLEAGELLAQKYNRTVIAVDEPGYGHSDSPSNNCSLDEIADAFIVVLDSLGIDRFAVAGSLMGCYLAMSMAARYGDRIDRVILTHPYKWPADKVAAAKKVAVDSETRVDTWDLKADGSHLTDTWNTRASWLSSTMNQRATMDELTYKMKRSIRYSQGINIQDPQLFPFDERAASIRCHILVLVGSHAEDLFNAWGLEGTASFRAAREALPQEKISIGTITDGNINLINCDFSTWASKVEDFLASE